MKNRQLRWVGARQTPSTAAPNVYLNTFPNTDACKTSTLRGGIVDVLVALGGLILFNGLNEVEKNLLLAIPLNMFDY